MYGVLCFALLFSLIGTILGGIWANESWGRFWGWDPKENGALMICLWQLAILHAVRGQYIKEYGLHLTSIFGGVVVAFSWFGVNLLGVGLHSYGFTSGVARTLNVFYITEAVFIAIGAVLWVVGKDAGASFRRYGREPLFRSIGRAVRTAPSAVAALEPSQAYALSEGRTAPYRATCEMPRNRYKPQRGFIVHFAAISPRIRNGRRPTPFFASP